MIHMTKGLYHELRDDYSGICRSCWHVAQGDTEPDAEDYTCGNCEKDNVQGIENLLVMGLIEIDEEAIRPYVNLTNRRTKVVRKQEIEL